MSLRGHVFLRHSVHHVPRKPILVYAHIQTLSLIFTAPLTTIPSNKREATRVSQKRAKLLTKAPHTSVLDSSI